MNLTPKNEKVHFDSYHSCIPTLTMEVAITTILNSSLFVGWDNSWFDPKVKVVGGVWKPPKIILGQVTLWPTITLHKILDLGWFSFNIQISLQGGQTYSELQTYICKQKRRRTKDMKPSSPRLSTSHGQFPFTLTNQPSYQKQQSQMHATPTRESLIVFCVPSVAFEKIIKESSRMVFFQILSYFEEGSNTFGVENIHTYLEKEGPMTWNQAPQS